VEASLFPHDPSGDRRLSPGALAYPPGALELARGETRAPELWLRGRGPWPPGPTIAIVGARAAVPDARRAAALVARRAAALGVCVASGMARGIDAAAHEAALDAGGTSLAVLGTGVDRVYPPEHGGLYTALVARGTIVSPHPPGAEPLPGRFPARNRVLAALASDVVLIQGERKSGTASTLAAALALGRRVWVHAGPLGDDAYAGNAAWLLRARSDARIALLVDPAEPAVRALAAGPPDASPRERVARALRAEPCSLDAIAREAACATPVAAATLVELELAGVAERLPGQRYRRRLP
jgi:DNA processing protein